MLSEADKNTIIRFARKYNVSALYVFGSSLKENVEARDIDLGVKGLEPKFFFKFYGELSRQVSKEVDLVDLSHKTLFNEVIESRGVKIYG